VRYGPKGHGIDIVVRKMLRDRRGRAATAPGGGIAGRLRSPGRPAQQRTLLPCSRKLAPAFERADLDGRRLFQAVDNDTQPPEFKQAGDLVAPGFGNVLRAAAVGWLLIPPPSDQTWPAPCTRQACAVRRRRKAPSASSREGPFDICRRHAVRRPHGLPHRPRVRVGQPAADKNVSIFRRGLSNRMIVPRRCTAGSTRSERLVVMITAIRLTPMHWSRPGAAPLLRPSPPSATGSRCAGGLWCRPRRSGRPSGDRRADSLPRRRPL